MELEVLKQQELLGREITVYGTNENPLFLAKDVAEWLGLTNVTNMVSRIDDDEVTKLNLGGFQGICNFLTENGVYEVLMQSRKPIAKDFKKGVKHILKEIRTNGGYIASHENDTPEIIMARGMKVAMQTIERVEIENKKLIQENIKMDMKTQFVDKVFDSKQNLTLSQTAKLLKLPFGRNTMAKELRAKGIFFKNSNEPKQSYIDRGYFVVFSFVNEAMSTPSNQTFVTQKGLAFLAKVFNVIIPKNEIIKFQ